MKDSILTDKSNIEVIKDMLYHVIENKVRQKPYIAVISKKQLWFGGGYHFKNTPNYIQKGLRANTGVRIPSKAEMDSAQMKYGYPALQTPFKELNRITNIAVRSLEKLVVNGNELNDIRIMKGRGYVTNDGRVKKDETQGIAVYVIFLASHEFRNDQNTWIKQQDDWVGWQILNNQEDYPKLLAERRQAASAIVKLNRKLLQLDEYKELESGRDKSLIPWESKS